MSERRVLPHAEIDEWTARRVLAGLSPRAIAAAAGVSTRTAYRWRRALVRLETVQIGAYQATFAIRRDGPPSRLSTWILRGGITASPCIQDYALDNQGVEPTEYRGREMQSTSRRAS